MSANKNRGESASSRPKEEKEKGVRNLFLSRFPPNLAAWRATHAEEKVPDPFFSRRAGKVLGGLIAGMMVLLAASFVVVVAVIPKPQKVELPPNIPAVNVSVLHIEPIRNFKDAFTIPGSIEPNSVVRVSAEVPGRIEQITGLEGRAVKAGDKLAELNTDLLKASLDQAKASMDFDARELERVKDLQNRGVATSMEHDQARAKADASKAMFDAARAQLDRAVIHAPTSGVLNKVPVEKGEYVTPGTVVAEIVEIDPVLVVVEVPERDMRFIHVGQRETILADALGGKEFTGRIHYISAVADPASRTTRVELVVPNGDGELKSGQIVTVHMERQTIPDAIMIPLGAAISLEIGYQVYVVEKGLAQPRAVKIGVLKGRDVQVVSGLAAGDDVIVRGHYYVGPGQTVKVVGQGDEVEPTKRPGTQPAQGARSAAGDWLRSGRAVSAAEVPVPAAGSPARQASVEAPPASGSSHMPTAGTGTVAAKSMPLRSQSPSGASRAAGDKP
jgi:membrane fusion protein (multidrug efflux system)